MHVPCTKHLQVVKSILHYIKNALGKGILPQNKGHLNIVDHSNADWTSSLGDRRSTT